MGKLLSNEHILIPVKIDLFYPTALYIGPRVFKCHHCKAEQHGAIDQALNLSLDF